MANFSRYIRLLAPARWRSVEVPVAACPLSREGLSPHACSLPELRLTHHARTSVYDSQNPRQPLSPVSARQIGYPLRHAGVQLELTCAGCAQTSGGQLIFVSPRTRGLCRRPCGCCLSALTPAGWSGRETALPDGVVGAREPAGWALPWHFQT